MRRLITPLVMIAVVAVAGCSSRTLTVPATMFPVECEILASPPDRADTITVAFPDPVDADHAPWPRNASERTLFNHLYETLIRVDCLNRIQGELAESWKRNRRGTRWTFVLREDARFWDGAPVRAIDVARSWHYATVELAARNAGIDSVSVVDDRTLHVYVNPARRVVPRILSDPAFNVAGQDRGREWPAGSGSYRAANDGTGSRMVFTSTIDADYPVLKVITNSGRDGRDLLEDGVDMMITDDPVVIDYASNRQRLKTSPLPWSQTYVLLSPARAERVGRGDRPADISATLSQRLARDAVRADARGWEPPPWWSRLGECAQRAPARWESPPPARQILYEAGDPVARDLAERIVALAASDLEKNAEAREMSSAVPGLAVAAAALVAEGIGAVEFKSRLRDGDAVGYILSVARNPADVCYEVDRLARRAPWIATARANIADVIVPLVDTRLHVIADPSRVGLSIDGAGNILPVSGRLERR